jgi:hypothetical protein
LVPRSWLSDRIWSGSFLAALRIPIHFILKLTTFDPKNYLFSFKFYSLVIQDLCSEYRAPLVGRISRHKSISGTRLERLHKIQKTISFKYLIFLDDSTATKFDPNVLSIRVYQTTRSVGLGYSEPHPAHLTCRGALVNRRRSSLQAHMTRAGSNPYRSGQCSC